MGDWWRWCVVVVVMRTAVEGRRLSLRLAKCDGKTPPHCINWTCTSQSAPESCQPGQEWCSSHFQISKVSGKLTNLTAECPDRVCEPCADLVDVHSTRKPVAETTPPAVSPSWRYIPIVVAVVLVLMAVAVSYNCLASYRRRRRQSNDANPRPARKNPRPLRRASFTGTATNNSLVNPYGPAEATDALDSASTQRSSPSPRTDTTSSFHRHESSSPEEYNEP